MSMLALPALLMGALGGAHCAVMCGAVASATCGRTKTSIAFNAGRVGTYVFLGVLAGAFGALSPVIGLALRPLAALALLGLGLHLAGFSHVFAGVERLGAPLWRRLAPYTKRPLPVAVVGAVWGFVPCGLVYAALTIAASSGGPLDGAITMLGFGLGTLPVMTALGALSGAVAYRLAHPTLRRIAGAAVLVLGLHQLTLAIDAADLSAIGGPPPKACCAHRQNERPPNP